MFEREVIKMTNTTNRETNSTGFWEFIGYISLALAVFGQIMVGQFYLIAQTAYLICNIASVIRDYALNLPRANKVKDFVFSGITIALILLRIL